MNRVEELKNIADRVEKYSYLRQFTPDELEEMRVDLAEKSIELKGHKEELKAVKEEFKIKMKPIETVVNDLLNNLHLKAESITGECLVELDQTLGVAIYYSQETGEEVGRRPLFANERQTTIFSAMRKEGTTN
jgi:hypothetical protein